MLRKPSFPPPGEIAPRAVMRAHENAQPAEEGERDDPVAAAQIGVPDRKMRAEANRKPVDELYADVVRKDRLQDGDGEEAERRQVADQESQAGEKAHHGGRRQMSDRAHD